MNILKVLQNGTLILIIMSKHSLWLIQAAEQYIYFLVGVDSLKGESLPWENEEQYISHREEISMLKKWEKSPLKNIHTRVFLFHLSENL